MGTERFISFAAHHEEDAAEIARSLGKMTGKITSRLFRHHLMANKIAHQEHDEQSDIPKGHKAYKFDE